jgi:hypothetical protein
MAIISHASNGEMEGTTDPGAVVDRSGDVVYARAHGPLSPSECGVGLGDADVEYIRLVRRSGGHLEHMHLLLPRAAIVLGRQLCALGKLSLAKDTQCTGQCEASDCDCGQETDEVREALAKGRWYPQMPPGLDHEDDDAYTNRLLGQDNPYDHYRNRQCSIGYHNECSDPVGKECECPCHHVSMNVERR